MKLPLSIFDFLTQLERNNNRSWFQDHKSQYDEIKTALDVFATALIERISLFDSSVRRETPKTSVFRIYRDIRFSPDKTPYKTHFGICIVPGGKSAPLAGYYLHLQNNASEMCGGLWCPDSNRLKKIREEIYYEPETFEAIVTAPAFTSQFGGLLTNDKLVRPPKGYPADFPYIDYLKYRHYLVAASLSNEAVLSTSFLNQCVTVFEKMYPLVNYLNTLLLND